MERCHQERKETFCWTDFVDVDCQEAMPGGLLRWRQHFEHPPVFAMCPEIAIKLSCPFCMSATTQILQGKVPQVWPSVQNVTCDLYGFTKFPKGLPTRDKYQCWWGRSTFQQWRCMQNVQPPKPQWFLLESKTDTWKKQYKVHCRPNSRTYHKPCHENVYRNKSAEQVVPCPLWQVLHMSWIVWGNSSPGHVFMWNSEK